MSQLERLVFAPKYMIGQIQLTDEKTAAGIVLPNRKPTQVWKVVRAGTGFDKFPDLKPGDMIIPEKQSPITVDRTLLSMVYEDWIFAMIPEGEGSQVDRIVLAPRYVMAKLIAQGGEKRPFGGGVIMPTTASSFWEIVRVGRDLETFPQLKVGDQIAPEKHVAISLDYGNQYGLFHENWILAMEPK